MSRSHTPWTIRDKRCLVTGGSSGIGRQTALELARMGARVVIVGRSEARCAEASASIQNESQNPAIEFLVADLSSQQQVRTLAGEVVRRYDRLDVLVNNAGALFLERTVSPDGFEMTWALNHLAPFLLTNLLSDLLCHSTPARVITVSSDAHRGGRLDLDHPDGPTGRYRGFQAYCASKLANILFTRGLARRLEGRQVTSNALHPGFVASHFFNGPGTARRLVRGLALPFALSVEKGAATSIYLASAEELEGATGGYYVRSKLATPAPAARDDEIAEHLWEISRRQTGLAALLDQR